MISIIGSNGFIGSRLARRLDKSGGSFLYIDKNFLDRRPNAAVLSISNTDKLRQALCDSNCVINLAAEHRDDVRPRSLYDEVNVQGARNICQVAREKGVSKIIFTSSVAVYGFAPPNTDEQGEINPFNDYGRTKWEAEQIYREWQAEAPDQRCLVIVRPTVVFGEGNRGNVYNLLRQIASGRFVMFGSGENRKSMAYVENVAAFLEYALDFGPGLHVYNYIDKPDFTMNELVSLVRNTLFDKQGVGLRLPAWLGMGIGYVADGVAAVTRKSLPVSSIRVKKFLATTQFETSVAETGFVPPVSLEEGLRRTLQYEFLEDNAGKQTFETE